MSESAGRCSPTMASPAAGDSCGDDDLVQVVARVAAERRFDPVALGAQCRGWRPRAAERPGGWSTPGAATEVSTTKNTTLKIVSAPSMPSTTGKVARMIGVAPRSPTHDTKPDLTPRQPEGRSGEHRQRPGHEHEHQPPRPPLEATGPRSLGNTSRPSSTNMAICISQAMASWNRRGCACAAGPCWRTPDRPRRRRGTRSPAREMPSKSRMAKAMVTTGYSPSYSRRTVLITHTAPRARRPADRTETHLHDEREHESEGTRPVAGDHAEHPDGEEHRRGIVAARLELEQRLEPAGEADTPGPQDREHGGRVGRGDDRAEQHPLGQVEPEQHAGEASEHERRDHDADAGQGEPRPEHRADVGPVGGEATAEEDERQRDHPDLAGDLEVVELDAEHALGAGHHPEEQEEEQARHAEPRRGLAEQRTGEQQRGGDQHGGVGRSSP
jgi:hypothetical protein